MKTKEKFLALVTDEKTESLRKNRMRIENRAMHRESQLIAMKVLKKLDELEWTQKDLANALKISPQQVNKIVKGRENLTLETQKKLQDVLDIPILATYYEDRIEHIEEIQIVAEKKTMRYKRKD